MTGPVSDGTAMIAGMTPVLTEGSWVFVTAADPAATARLLPHAIGSFREAEGMSLILPQGMADAGGPPMRCITLQVYSSLDGVGLTAAVATALAARGIPCNMVAAFHHDHVFVPADRAAEAQSVLQDAQKAAQSRK
jgi:uncharacterized protein